MCHTIESLLEEMKWRKKYEHQIEFDMEKVANAAHKP